MVGEFGMINSMIFKQTRIGIHGKPFTIYKVKTMEDGKITRPWFRLTRLDELPQLWNVLKGDMALVGPRPLIPEEDNLLRGYPLTVKPGITGWWQIHGCVQEEVAELDRWYVENKCLRLDVKIIFLTVRWVWRNLLSVI